MNSSRHERRRSRRAAKREEKKRERSERALVRAAVHPFTTWMHRHIKTEHRDALRRLERGIINYGAPECDLLPIWILSEIRSDWPRDPRAGLEDFVEALRREGGQCPHEEAVLRQRWGEWLSGSPLSEVPGVHTGPVLTGN